MTEISFYLVSGATTPAQLDAVVPPLLKKALAAGHKVLVRCPDRTHVQRLSEALWDSGPTSFFAHGTPDDDPAVDPRRQPLFITDTQTNPNEADLLVRLAGAPADDFSSYVRVVDLFGGTDAARADGRTRWQQFKGMGYPLSHYVHEGSGWVKKA